MAPTGSDFQLVTLRASLTLSSMKIKNIARGTTDPVYDLNYLFGYIQFVFNLAAEITQGTGRKTLQIPCNFSS